jgi:hypothetical protein
MIPGYCECGKPAGRTGKCGTCERDARKPARRKAPRVRIRKHSKKRARELKEYTPLRAEFLLAHPLCQIRLEGCTNVAVEIHHTTTSALDFLNVSTWMAGCRHCHHITETVLSAEKRRELGLLK